MLVLLGTSTLAAALVPVPDPETETTTTTPTREADPLPRGGELVRVTVDAQARRPKAIELPLGDQLALIVRSEEAGQVEIAGLGQLEDVLPLSPARFDILPVREEALDVRMIEPERVLATIEVVDEGAASAPSG